MRVLLLGEAPNEATRGRPRAWLLPSGPRGCHSAARLLRFTGYGLTDYLRVFQRRDNLVHDVPPRGSKGYTFPLSEGRIRAAELVRRHGLLGAPADRVDRVVILGRRVAKCFEWERHDGGRLPPDHVPYFTWSAIRASRFGADRAGDYLMAALVPHPSGVNTWWNHEGNRSEAREFFEALRQEVLRG